METIQEELFNNGPVNAQIEVHEDLISYQSGVYNVSLEFLQSLPY
jgi:hypothetical protein